MAGATDHGTCTMLFAAIVSVIAAPMPRRHALERASCGPRQVQPKIATSPPATRRSKKSRSLYDDNKSDDAAQKAEDAVRADLLAQMSAILDEPARKGFGPAKLNLETFYKGDEGFGTLDGLRFDSVLGDNGEKAGRNGADGKYVEPKAHIIVTTQTMFERWLRAHKDWWGKDIKNVPQQIGTALKDESFYTQAISSGSAVVNFNSLPIAKPAAATFAYGMLAGRTQSDIPDAADQVFVAALANGKVYIASGSIKPKVRSRPASRSGPATTRKPRRPTTISGSRRSTGRPTTNSATFAKRAKTPTSAASRRMAPKQPSFVEATRQAERLLSGALNTR